MKNVNWFERAPEDPTGCQNLCIKLRGESEPVRKVMSTVVWVVSTARNAIVVIVCTVMAFGLDPVIPDEPSRNTTFILTGNIKAGTDADKT